MKKWTVGAALALGLCAMGLGASDAFAAGQRDGRWEGRQGERFNPHEGYDRRMGYDRQERRDHYDRHDRHDRRDRYDRYDRGDRRWDRRQGVVVAGPGYYYGQPSGYYAADPYAYYGSPAVVYPPSHYGFYGPRYVRQPSSQFCLNWNVADAGYRSRWQSAFVGVCL